MSKTVKKSLSISEIKELVEAKQELDNAKEKLDILKEKFKIDDLAAGKYFAEGEGVVTKNVTVRATVNYKKLLEDNPNIDVKVYTEYTEVSSVLIKPLKSNESLLKRILK